MDTPQGREAWDAAAAAVLRRAGRLSPDDPDTAVWAKLTRRTVEGLPVPALGTPSLTAGLPEVGMPGHPPFVRGAGAPTGAGWDVRAPVFDTAPDRAAASVMADLEGGAGSIWLGVGPAATAVADVGRVLDGVLTDIAPVVLSTTDPAAWSALAATLGADVAAGSSLGADPLGDALRDRRPADDVAAAIATAADIATSLHIGAVVVDATVAHEAGAGEVGELAWSLAAGAHYLRALTDSGLDVDTACRLVGFRYATTDAQFLTIAKLRAARLLWHRVTELSGAAVAARAQSQHAVTSRPMTTRYDPWVNMLRGTIAAFAAGVGGAAAVTVWPFDAALGVPDEFGRRIARNVSALLIEESHVGAVADPAGGAHAVEKLTQELALAAWAAFGELEAAGGAAAVLADGSLPARFETTAHLRAQRVATRRWPVTGVSEFPIADETLLVRRPWPVGDPWADVSWAAPFEELRDAPVQQPAFVVPLGSAAAHGPRLTFMSNLLTAGGIRFVLTAPVIVAGDVAGRLGSEAAPVVVVLGADDDYRRVGAEVIDALRTAGAGAVVLAGRPPAPLVGVVDDSVAAGDDVLAFLHRTRDRLRAGLVVA
jgi:methylmalonyl-CoA mutase